jgi:beta-glucosidase
MSIRRVVLTVAGLVGLGVVLVGAAVAQTAKPAADKPWMNTALDADARADLMVKAMTLDEKIQMVHGNGWGVLRDGDPVAARNNHGAGFVPGVDRLGLPDIQLADSAVGVRGTARDGRYSTLLPSVIGMTASWDPAMGHLYGDVIGRELRDLGFNMSIGGGVDLIREPRNGRNFEYASEDPLLAGIMVGNLAMGVQSNQVMGDIKHYVLNDQETGRNSLNAILNKRAMQETDLLAFQIAIKMAKPAGVMCSYNRVNGDYACENDYTLNQVLKKDWGFQGWVLSDWEGTHSTVKAALAGLDMEQPGETYFGPALKQAVLDGKVPEARVDDMVHRIVRSMFVNGVIDHPPVRRVVDPFKGRDDAQKIEEKSLVLLKNEGGILPLNAAKVKTIAVIGGHADMGVMSGGGSAQVDAPGGHPGGEQWDSIVYFPSSPLRYVKEAAPDAVVTFDDGMDAAKAASAAKGADVVLVFVTKWQSEGQDSLTSALPNNQDALVAAVAAANPKTVVILETGGPVTMPWVGSVKGIMESWYPGIGGGEAIANVLFGKVNPSGKLPVTFTASDEDLPHPHVAGLTARTGAGSADGNAGGEQAKDFPVDYNVEGMMVGYKWFEAKGKTPLFPFGFGLSYTSYAYSGLKVAPGAASVSFEVKNTGKMAGDEIAEVYVTMPTSAGEPFKKLAGFTRVSLAAGEKKMVTVELNPLVLSVFSVEKNAFEEVDGEYVVEVGGSVAELPLKAKWGKASGR